jgi:hypothetical protein
MSSLNGGGELVGGENGFIVIGVGFAVVSTILGTVKDKTVQVFSSFEKVSL